tara:strand:- start:383 stop:550 length:168 start_codon:yes stop_codon:yes gene_type:complete
MKLGDLVEKIFKVTGIKWLHNKIWFDFLGYESCGCNDRKKFLNDLKINRNGNKND